MKFQNLQIGDVFESNNYGLFKVIDNLSHANIVIEFLKTGNRKSTRFQNLIKGKVKDGEISKSIVFKVGEIYQIRNFGAYKIIDVIDARNITIKFLDTGYVKKVQSSIIKLGAIKDPMKPTVYGVGIKGDNLPSQVDGKIVREYRTWKEILRRCYDEKHLERFPTYRGCTVCQRWHSYDNFYEDIKKLEGYSEWLNNFRYQIDKDIINPSNKVYCPEYCKFVTDTENSLDANRRRHNRLLVKSHCDSGTFIH